MTVMPAALLSLTLSALLVCLWILDGCFEVLPDAVHLVYPTLASLLLVRNAPSQRVLLWSSFVLCSYLGIVLFQRLPYFSISFGVQFLLLGFGSVLGGLLGVFFPKKHTADQDTFGSPRPPSSAP